METWAESVASASRGAMEIDPYQILKRRNPENDNRVEWRIPRSCDLVAPDLLRVFRQLVTGQARWPLYLWGLQGRGKTLAVLSLCDLVRGSRYFTPRALMDTCSRNPVYLPWEAEGRRNEIELAVLDEVGAGNVNDFHFDMVLAFADDRELRHNRVAAYASNLDPLQMTNKYDKRAASRILCGTVYQLTGPDRRIQDAQAVAEHKGNP